MARIWSQWAPIRSSSWLSAHRHPERRQCRWLGNSTSIARTSWIRALGRYRLLEPHSWVARLGAFGGIDPRAEPPNQRIEETAEQSAAPHPGRSKEQMVTIRQERPDDFAAVRALNEAAFGRAAEGAVVDSIRTACPDAVSLVAVDDGRVVGHIFFSPVLASGRSGPAQGMGLAPMAVLPERQRRGIGTMLVRAGIEALRRQNCPYIIVLGHPEYYPRFGFVPASRYGLSCQWDGVPDEAFMILVLDEPTVAGLSGTARYRDEFDQAM